MRKFFMVVSIVVSTLFCGMHGVSAEERQEIIVSAAASLTNAMEAIGNAFEEMSGIHITLNFASSGVLFKQLEQGAPADVYASANQTFMNQAEEKGLIAADTRHDFAKNSLVLATPSDVDMAVTSVQDLVKPEVERIAMGDPAIVPAGQYAQESLEGYGVWDKLTDRVIYGNSVRQVLDYLRRGEVDAGIVFSTDAALEKETVRVVAGLGHHAQILYPIAVTSEAQEHEHAVQFVEFVLSADGQAILQQFGFKPVNE